VSEQAPGDERAAEVEALRRRVDDLERFTRRVAHELATPLTSAAGFARLLLERGGHDAETTDGLRRIARSTTTASELVARRLSATVGDPPDHLALRPVVEEAVAATFDRDTDVVIDVVPQLVVFGPPRELREAVGLLVRAVATLLTGPRDGPASVRLQAATLGPDVVTVTCVAGTVAPLEPDAGLTSDDPLLEPALAVLRQLQGVLQGLGGRLWVPAPAAPSDRFSLLVQLPRGRGRSDLALR
jgi:hypothetical protein